MSPVVFLLVKFNKIQQSHSFANSYEIFYELPGNDIFLMSENKNSNKGSDFCHKSLL